MEAQVPNKERIQLLYDGLRSGRFEQGHGALRIDSATGSRHCCLGVACEIARENGLNLQVSTSVNLRNHAYFGQIRENSYLPLEVVKWYGFRSNNPRLVLTPEVQPKWWQFWRKPKKAVYESAISMNDDLGLNFDNIAEAFKRTYL